MKSALIITSIINDMIRIRPDVLFAPYDMVISCDAGTDRAIDLGIKPDIIIGDLDSSKTTTVPDSDTIPEVNILPHEKDMTDTEAALDLAYDRGARVITIIGGLGGRFDHTMANIGLLSKYAGKADVFIMDGDNFIRMLVPGEYKIIGAGYEYLGLIAYGGSVKGLTVQGAYYPLKDYTLLPNTSYAISNEITEDPATISFTDGQLLVIQSNDAL